MSIEKIYSSTEMTRVELGEYIPEVKAEVEDLRDYRNQQIVLTVVAFGAVTIIVAVAGLMVGVNAHTLIRASHLAIASPFLFAAPAYVLGNVLMAISEIKALDYGLELEKAKMNVVDRSEDLQNETNRLWVKREQILAMKDNNNAGQEYAERMKLIEEKFGIHPNVKSEEEYLAYWANPKK